MLNCISLSDLLKNQQLSAIIENLISLMDSSVSILDIDHNLILGETIETKSTEYPITFQLQTIGWVRGEAESQVLAQLLTYLANQQRLVFFDDLTQIPNRRYFSLYLEQQWLRSRREHLPLSLLLCDIDYFKFYNDYFGHPRGDICLQQVAQVLSGVLKRPSDLLFRYGGEEFAIILPNTEQHGAETVAQELLLSVPQLEMANPTSPLDSFLTISIGVTTVIPQNGLRKEDLLEAADVALYQAKETGRNGYCVQRILPPNSSSRD